MLIDDLRGVYLFEGLSDEQLGDLIAVGDEVRFEAGDVLFREGEVADFWWVLLSGRVELLRRTRWEESVAGVMDRPGVWAGGFRACLTRPDTWRPAAAPAPVSCCGSPPRRWGTGPAPGSRSACT